MPPASTTAGAAPPPAYEAAMWSNARPIGQDPVYYPLNAMHVRFIDPCRHRWKMSCPHTMHRKSCSTFPCTSDVLGLIPLPESPCSLQLKGRGRCSCLRLQRVMASPLAAAPRPMLCLWTKTVQRPDQVQNSRRCTCVIDLVWT